MNKGKLSQQIQQNFFR